jgi:hypothetical protein
MNATKSSARVLVIALTAAVLSTAFVFALPSASTYTDQQSSGSRGTTSNTIQEYADSNQHPPSFAANDKLDQARITELRIALRDVWVDHVVWTRQYIVAAVADASDTDYAAQRLLDNQVDIGNAIKPFYGDDAGDTLTSLLQDHILIAGELLTAAKAGDSSGLQEAEEKWYQNADDIATFLSDANPHWPKDHLVNMLDDHLALTKTEAVARLTGDYSADINAFDEIHDQAMTMADELADGIVKQFPERFEVERSATAS